MSNTDQLSKRLLLDQTIRRRLHANGIVDCQELSYTLQGSIWYGSMRKTKIAIKIANKKIAESQRGQIHENIMKECDILKYLTSNAGKNTDTPSRSSIVKYLGFDKDKDNHYLFMEYGGSGLFDYIKNAHDNKLPQSDLYEWHLSVKIIFKQMVECIEYIHSRNVCHFDVSLENFLISEPKIIQNGAAYSSICIKICDFGLAEKFEAKNDQEISFKSDKICGKRVYMSPEIVLRKEKFNAKANDVWCLGVCLYMMIMGHAPWEKARNNPEFDTCINGQTKRLVEWINAHSDKYWRDDDLCDLLDKIFKYENKRIDLRQIKQHTWLNKELTLSFRKR